MDRTNIFFLVVTGGAAWFIFREYQKQKAAQDSLLLQRRLQTTSIGPTATDYAERIAQERDWTREASIWGG